ncbi:glutathione S-transferase N-terminal domain-containing protein [Halomonas vilamensis]|uniref:Glutathione S-transferase N-terminal domain-containing protein n=1 Tax=Vreelandella vilamensis TaxID=531309 RepID=A0ABU1H6H8_9GAMM|nr:glutathione S-transferase N-terminal domain-containing protein [Halomonas vilamensis]MDR5899277.1 glutathione S-transferase N-terminal domain-containing protein [Halomonas vilamensis]
MQPSLTLYLNTSSPYARVVHVCLHETRLIEQTELRWCDPWAADSDLVDINPLSRIPALVTEDGQVLTESLLIAHYLDSLSEDVPLVPQDQQEVVLSLAGFGQGLMEAAFQTVIARKHQGSEADTSVLGMRRVSAIERTLAMLNTHSATEAPQTERTLGGIAVAVALAYLSFRLPAFDWENRFPALQAWYAEVIDSESFALTAFE